jgi:hypothetical protein
MGGPRWRHCQCRPQPSRTFRPLAAVLPERTTPDMRYLGGQVRRPGLLRAQRQVAGRGAAARTAPQSDDTAAPGSGDGAAAGRRAGAEVARELERAKVVSLARQRLPRPPSGRGPGARV